MVDVEWKPTAASMFLVAIQVEALDRHKLLADVTRVLSDEQVNILSAIGHHDPGPGGGEPVHASRWPTPSTSDHLLAAVRKVDGVYDAYRVTSGT